MWSTRRGGGDPGAEDGWGSLNIGSRSGGALSGLHLDSYCRGVPFRLNRSLLERLLDSIGDENREGAPKIGHLRTRRRRVPAAAERFRELGEIDLAIR